MNVDTVNEVSEWYNPAGTDGFEFVEFASSDPEALIAFFSSLGFTATSHHLTCKVTRLQQGDITFLVTEKKGGFADEFVQQHGPCACSFGLRVENVDTAMAHVIKQGAHVVDNLEADGLPIAASAIEGIGGSRLYLVDQHGQNGSLYKDFTPLADTASSLGGCGLETLDHLTHNVHRGKMSVWADFYEKLFNFREIRYFDISGEYTGLFSKAMTAPCGKVRIPINESSDDKSQIAEYLKQYNGEGIQHIALSTRDIYHTVELLKTRGVAFMSAPPDSYYDMLAERLPGHGEDVSRMQRNGILMDGMDSKRLLLQIFTDTVIGPIFFEIIQRKGDDGFGEGNFQALFESLERDQIERGVLDVD